MVETTPLQVQVGASLVVEYAQNILNKIFADDPINNAKALFVKNRTLTITCSGSIIAQEIRLKQNEIIEAINAKLGNKEVDRIRYLT